MADDREEPEEFKSRLASGRQRFLAHAVVDALVGGRRTAADFIRHFPPAAIMEGLKGKPALRAKILEATTGIVQKVGKKKTPVSAGEDLQIALDEKVTDPETILSMFQPDDRVRYLADTALWDFLVEGEFWNEKADGIEYEIIKSHVSYLLDRALTDSLITHRDIVDGIGVDKIAELLPRAELGWILGVALERGRAKKPFTDADLLGEAPSAALADHIPLPHIWERVIVKRVAEEHGYAVVPAPSEPAPPMVEDDETKEQHEEDFHFGDEPTQNGDVMEISAELPVAAAGKKD